MIPIIEKKCQEQFYILFFKVKKCAFEIITTLIKPKDKIHLLIWKPENVYNTCKFIYILSVIAFLEIILISLLPLLQSHIL